MSIQLSPGILPYATSSIAPLVPTRLCTKKTLWLSAADLQTVFFYHAAQILHMG
jgi:hypothetical protein